MNCERSQRRDWQRTVAIGLGRALTKDEARAITLAWRHYSADRNYAGPWPLDLMAQWKEQDERTANIRRRLSASGLNPELKP
jgi:hypothetical protein